MRYLVLLVACAVLGALGLYCLFFEPAAPITVVGPAIAFAGVVGALTAARQLLPLALLIAIRVASFVFGAAILFFAIATFGQIGTLWIVWGIVLAAIVAAVLGTLQAPVAPAPSP